MKPIRARLLALLFLVFIFTHTALADSLHELTSAATAAKEGAMDYSIAVSDSLLRFETQDRHRSTEEILQRIRNLEQICFTGPLEKVRAIGQAIDRRLESFFKVLQSRAEKLSIGYSEAPDDYLNQDNPQWDEAHTWQTIFSAKSEAQKCQMLELAYTTALARITLAKPSTPIKCFRDIMCNNIEGDLFKRDLRRLQWETRHITTLTPESIPAGCKDFRDDFDKRLAFAAPAAGAKLSRWAMGKAFGMCGRSMSAHYQDEEISEGKIPKPAGWGMASGNGATGAGMTFDDIIGIENQNITPKIADTTR